MTYRNTFAKIGIAFFAQLVLTSAFDTIGSGIPTQIRIGQDVWQLAAKRSGSTTIYSGKLISKPATILSPTAFTTTYAVNLSKDAVTLANDFQIETTVLTLVGDGSCKATIRAGAVKTEGKGVITNVKQNMTPDGKPAKR